MNTSRPLLTKHISLEDFQSFYWLKEELVQFCKEHGINTQGGKREIADRIEAFLRTGKVTSIKKVSKKTVSKFDWNKETLNLATEITDSYKNTENVRTFFTKQIGKHFAFNVQFMNWMKVNVGKTLQDAILEWKRLHELKKDTAEKKEIAPQFEYNRYIRDFLQDNPDKALKDAIKYWKIKRSLPEDRRYKKTDLLLE
ncbi:MAG: cytoplasmic protein [Candidatus Kerfeldbacteria bacterium]|nr:cytoplasmic protein [Candidatus Kerfeldbacteria bacterium]